MSVSAEQEQTPERDFSSFVETSWSGRKRDIITPATEAAFHLGQCDRRRAPIGWAGVTLNSPAGPLVTGSLVSVRLEGQRREPRCLPAAGRGGGTLGCKAPALAFPRTYLPHHNQNLILTGGLLFLALPWDFQKIPENDVQ